MVNGTNTSGFGYDTSTHSVTAEPAVWDSYIQVHKEAGKWRNKIFRHYEDLCIIFGKDRAQGNKAKDFAQMEEDANNEEQSEQIEDGFEEQTIKNEESPNIGSKKRKRVDVLIKGITIAANVLREKVEKAANSMNQAILGETEVQKKKASIVIPEISKMQSLSTLDRFKASRKIMRGPETMLSFWNLEGEDRKGFVRFMLEE
ncbi:unnamed protein product [Lactuca saligna]|uniref:Uncharacterized protein n=1 Tax=Lactuca saligna TaxID=75948 RepID=A0AA36EP71_LACSI|nr:unnamed protein product [Lactuca saligna]